MLQNTRALELMLQDLHRSGLGPEDLLARVMDSPERAMTHTSAQLEGYVIPYLDILGMPNGHYRVRVFESDPKYKQPQETQNHIYFPKDFLHTLDSGTHQFIILTEGEKKARLATKLGYPAVAVGGVDSWRNRILVMPPETTVTKGPNNEVKAKIGKGQIKERLTSTLAVGMQDLIDLLMIRKLQLIIIYDTDVRHGVKPEVQRAAANLAFDLRFRGIPFNHIRQLFLPFPQAGQSEKMALDDLLVLKDGPETFRQLVETTLAKRSAFPRHPSIRDFINKRLTNNNISRRDVQQVAIAILSDLDANGLRLRNSDDPAGDAFYFSYLDHKLLKFQLPRSTMEVNQSPFGSFLYKAYGLSSQDARVATWLGTQFLGEDPVENVSPYKVLARPPLDDARIYYQLSDGQYITISPSEDTPFKDLPGVELHDNGENEILFEADQTEALDVKTLLVEYGRRNQEAPVQGGWWAEVLNDVRLKDHTRHKDLLNCLLYLSPWLYRWRGLQLPVEMILGEPGSGKSTLCEMRLRILNGRPSLRNAPTEIRDWHASISSAGGLHVTDNVVLSDKILRQRLSDEICRIITEPNPVIEMRRLYTNADLVKIPVRCVFIMTALQQPFSNADVIQRSFITELEKDSDATYDDNWAQRQILKRGGREAWVSHHLHTLHRFFKLVQKEWDPNYRAKHRLVHFEQVMILMGKTLGIDTSWFPQVLGHLADKPIVEADWAFEGLCSWADFIRQNQMNPPGQYFTAGDIATWSQNIEEYMKCEYLINTRRLGKYMVVHKSMLEQVAGIRPAGMIMNRQRYAVDPLGLKK